MKTLHLLPLLFLTACSTTPKLTLQPLHRRRQRIIPPFVILKSSMPTILGVTLTRTTIW